MASGSTAIVEERLPQTTPFSTLRVHVRRRLLPTSIRLRAGSGKPAVNSPADARVPPLRKNQKQSKPPPCLGGKETTAALLPIVPRGVPYVLVPISASDRAGGAGLVRTLRLPALYQSPYLRCRRGEAGGPDAYRGG